MIQVKEDLTGHTFTKLTVLRQTDDRIYTNGTHRACWLCECSCEEHNQIVVTGYDLKAGHTKSCGCLHNESRKKTNKRDLSGEFGILWSTNTNEEVYFDLDDAEKILQYCWYIDTSTGYPATNINKKKITMHKLLGYYRPDHYNRNKLDNRRENLVQSTQKENSRNMPKRSTNTSGFIGVCWNKAMQKWQAAITVDNVSIYLGCFCDKNEAIRTRLKAELKYFKFSAPQRHLFEEYGIVEK